MITPPPPRNSRHVKRLENEIRRRHGEKSPRFRQARAIIDSIEDTLTRAQAMDLLEAIR